MEKNRKTDRIQENRFQEKRGEHMEQKKNRFTFYLKLILLVICFLPLSILLFLLDTIIKMMNWIVRKKEPGEQLIDKGM